jgi:hypothetical protein
MLTAVQNKSKQKPGVTRPVVRERKGKIPNFLRRLKRSALLPTVALLWW